jgi:hypothetical protein
VAASTAAWPAGRALAKMPRNSAGGAPSDGAVLALANENRNLWDSMGADYARAEAAANRADESGNPADIRAAITELGTVWIGLPAGSPIRGRTLTLLAEMHLALAVSTDDLTRLTDAAGLAITAIRTAPEPRVAQGGACVLADCLTLHAVLSYAASARLLGAAANRPRQPSRTFSCFDTCARLWKEV